MPGPFAASPKLHRYRRAEKFFLYFFQSVGSYLGMDLYQCFQIVTLHYRQATTRWRASTTEHNIGGQKPRLMKRGGERMAKPDCGASRHSNTKTSRNRHGTIIGRDRLMWRTTNHGLSLHHAAPRLPLVRIERDGDWAGMYRIRLPDSRLSDVVNLTRAKDAALSIALHALNSGTQERRSRASPVRELRREVSGQRPDADRIPGSPNGFLAEGRS